jgi:hypothetical protein
MQHPIPVLRAAALAALLALAPPSLAQTDFESAAELDAQVRRVELALNRIQTEQRAVYQQFQMMQELRRGELEQDQQSSYSYTPPATPPNYDEEVEARQARESRLQGYTNELDRLYARYRELEDQKKPLLDELAELALRRR